MRPAKIDPPELDDYFFCLLDIKYRLQITLSQIAYSSKIGCHSRIKYKYYVSNIGIKQRRQNINNKKKQQVYATLGITMFYILPLFEDYIGQCYKIDINELSSREIGKQKWRITKQNCLKILILIILIQYKKQHMSLNPNQQTVEIESGSMQKLCNTLSEIIQFLIYSLIAYSSLISTLIILVVKFNHREQDNEIDGFKQTMYIFIGVEYAMDITKKIACMTLKSIRVRFKIDIATNVVKLIIQLFFGFGLLANQYSQSKIIGSLCFIGFILLIILRISFVTCVACRLSRKLALANLQDQEYITYKLSLTNNKEIKQMFVRIQSKSNLQTGFNINE